MADQQLVRTCSTDEQDEHAVQGGFAEVSDLGGKKQFSGKKTQFSGQKARFSVKKTEFLGQKGSLGATFG